VCMKQHVKRYHATYQSGAGRSTQAERQRFVSIFNRGQNRCVRTALKIRSGPNLLSRERIRFPEETVWPSIPPHSQESGLVTLAMRRSEAPISGLFKHTGDKVNVPSYREVPYGCAAVHLHFRFGVPFWLMG
jgi:hypothetical protein